jgi:O-antigen/teichoic acid export membrane protein
VMKDLKERAIRGALAKVCAQATIFTVRVGSVAVLARLLSPGDFGIVGMVTAFTGILNLLKDFGLSAATVQRLEVTDEQISTLFWFNIVFGGVLASLLMGSAPLVVRFYHEPRLLSVTIVLATAFIFNAAGVQHSALLQRQMRFTALAAVDIVSLVVSTTVGISMAALGFKYWALVAAAVSLPLVATVCLWLTTGWIPGRPRAGVGIGSMMHFGSTLTLITIIIYIAYNSDKMLLGRFWGAAALGIYGRAYQLISMPTDNLNSAVGDVAFSALSRVQHDPTSFRNYFLKSYSLVLALTIPITIAVALFGPELIFILLGPKWKDAVPIFRLLAPTILVFALINPIGWLMFSLGMVGRSLKASLVFAPTVIGSYALGLRYGPKGVAFAFSAVMIVWAVPLIAWGIHGTVISLRDIAVVASRPLLSGTIAAATVLGVAFWCGRSLSPFPRLLLEGTTLVTAYAAMLLYVMGQKAFYLDLFWVLTKRQPVESRGLIPT